MAAGAVSDHLVLPRRVLHRPTQLLGCRGPRRYRPDAHAVFGSGNAGQQLTQLPQLMRLQATFEDTPLQPFTVALQQFGQLPPPFVARENLENQANSRENRPLIAGQD